MIRKTKFYLLILLLFVTACSSIPKNTQNSCAIFEERYLWYKHSKACLLYTSDAADDSLRVDLGGRRIIKKVLANSPGTHLTTHVGTSILHRCNTHFFQAEDGIRDS